MAKSNPSGSTRASAADFVSGKARVSSQRNGTNSGNAIPLDDDDHTPPKDDDLKDEDYKEPSKSNDAQKTRLKNASRKSKYDEMNKDDITTEVKEIEKKFADCRKKRTEDRKELRKVKEQRTELKEENKQHVLEITRLKAELRDSKQANAKQREVFDEAQVDWLARINETTYLSHPDNIIRDAFHVLLNRCRDWVREWYSDQASKESMPFFENVVARCTSADKSSAKDLLLNKLRIGHSTSIRQMGYAWLARQLISNFIEDPFFTFGQSGQALKTFYSTSRQGKLECFNVRSADSCRKPQEGLCVARRNAKTEARFSRCAASPSAR